MKYALIISLLLLLISCQKNTVAENNKYFYEIGQEISPFVDNQQKLLAIQKRELNNYLTTKNEKYLISSKLTELFLYNSDRIKQTQLVYKLLKLNNDRYKYISIFCNSNLAYKFEKTSPQQAMRFIDEAIKADLETMYYLPHSYHMKGRLYYNQKDYVNARYYFTQALKNYKQKLYIASMYNNFGMVDNKLNNPAQAIKNTQKGIEILEGKFDKKFEDTNFLI